jgi:hypothetical protein
MSTENDCKKEETKVLSQDAVRRMFLDFISKHEERLKSDKVESINNIFICTHIDGQSDMLSVIKKFIDSNFA